MTIGPRNNTLSLLSLLVLVMAGGVEASAQGTGRVAATERMLNDGWSKHDGEVASKYFAPSAVSYTNGIQDSVKGPEDVKETLQSLVADFPDMTIRPVAVRASGDHVYTRWHFEGTDKATKKKVSLEGMNDDRWKGSLIVEERSYFDFTPVLEAQGYTIKRPAADSQPK